MSRKIIKRGFGSFLPKAAGKEEASKAPAPESSEGTLLTIPAIIDQETTAIVFSLAQARRKSERWVSLPDGMEFSFAQNSWGYVVESGNEANFSQPQLFHSVDLSGLQSVTVEAKIGTYSLERASVGLFCFLLNAAGKVLRKNKIVCDGGYGTDVLEVPPDAEKMCFAIRLEGSGKIAGFSLNIQSIKSIKQTVQKPPPANAKPEPLKEDLTPAGKAADCVKTRNFNQGIEIITNIPSPNDRERKQLLRCYASLHEFGKVVTEFENMPPKGQADAGSRLYYLRALANLGLTEKAHSFIATCCLDPGRDQRNLEFLAMAYPFAVYISDILARFVIARIIASAPHFTKKSLNQLLRCAHDLVTAERFEEFHRIMNGISALDLMPEDQAKIEILTAHAAYVISRYDLQLEALNRAIVSFGLNPLQVKDSQEPLALAGISSPMCVSQSVHGPLVTVLMTSYNSEKTIDYALRSLMAQTYSDLEIIVIDDASSDKSCSKIKKLCAMDKRISLIELSENGGTYVAKNHGLKRASGIFVTCQDSDDWAHPQKIERTVAALVADEKLVAAAVQHVRYDPRRGFRGLGGYIRFDASSMMYRRKEILERIGFYDSVRVGGDSEFQYRLERVFGKHSFKQIPDLLSLVLWSETSLSGGGAFAIDDDAGIFTPFRNVYRNAFCNWQEKTDRLFIDFPLNKRPFKAPKDGLP